MLFPRKQNKSKSKSDISSDSEPESIRHCYPHFNILDPKHKYKFLNPFGRALRCYKKIIIKQRKIIKISMQITERMMNVN